jgi:hypothetical protein
VLLWALWLVLQVLLWVLLVSWVLLGLVRAPLWLVLRLILWVLLVLLRRLILRLPWVLRLVPWVLRLVPWVLRLVPWVLLLLLHEICYHKL